MFCGIITTVYIPCLRQLSYKFPNSAQTLVFHSAVKVVTSALSKYTTKYTFLCSQVTSCIIPDINKYKCF